MFSSCMMFPLLTRYRFKRVLDTSRHRRKIAYVFFMKLNDRHC